MLPVFLAFVVFHGAEAPKIKGAYHTLDECLVAASKLNKDADNPWLHQITGGYVCLTVVGNA